MGFLESVRAVREHLRDAGAVSLDAVSLECGADVATVDRLVRELVDVQKVAVLDGGVIRWVGGGAAGSYTPRHLAEGVLRTSSAIEGERKQVTVLFVDVTQSTKLAGQLDPEAWHEVLDGFFRILTAGVHRFDGTVNQYTGDGIMALFGAPFAFEDHAQRACHAVLHAQEALVDYAAEVERAHGVAISARFGLNTGEVVVGRIGDDLRMDYTAQGQIVALAQRMESIAEPGSCRLTGTTAALASGFFDVRPLGRREVKGAAEPVEVFELVGRGGAASRFDLSRARGLTKFVGRRDEMDRLVSLLARCGDGHGQVVVVEGDAGSGKSRLCHEFADFCRAWGLRVFQTEALVHARRLPLLPIVELVRRLFHIARDDAAPLARVKVDAGLAAIGCDVEAGEVVREFLGMTGGGQRPSRANADSRRRLILDVMVSLLDRGSAAGPDIVVVEDLHWCDEASGQMLAEFIARVSSLRVLVITNLRPGSRPEWLAVPHGHLLPLSQLGSRERDEMLDALLGSDPTTADLSRTIAARAGGNPFFIEEMVRMLVDSGLLEGTIGDYRARKPPSGISIPGTVQAILASRIDRLAAGEKSVLQMAAVIGAEVPFNLLARVCGVSPAELSVTLDHLEQLCFLRRTAAGDTAYYAFEHQLTQEVAMESQLRVVRRRTHAAVARAIEEEVGERIEEHAGRIAMHLEEAGEPLAAAGWFRRAAAWASGHDKASGIAYWRKVRDLARSEGESSEADRLLHEACLHLLMLSWRQGFDSFLDLESEGIAAARRLGDAVGAVLVRLWAAQSPAGSNGTLRDFPARVRETESLARECGDARTIATIRWQSSYARWAVGDIDGCLAHLADLGPMMHDDAEPGLLGFDLGSMSMMLRSIAVAWRGERDEAAAIDERAIAMTRRRDRLEEHGWALAAAGEIALVCGQHRNREAPDLDRAVAESIGIADRLGSPFSRVTTLDIGVASAHLHFGRYQEAIEALRESLATIRGQGTYVEGEPRVLARLAAALGRVGDFDEARSRAAEAINRARELGTVHYEALALVVSARLGLEAVGPGYTTTAKGELAVSRVLIERTAARWLLEPIRRLESRADGIDVAEGCSGPGNRTRWL